MKNNDATGLVALAGIIGLAFALAIKGSYQAAAILLVAGVFSFLIESTVEFLFGVVIDLWSSLDWLRKILPLIPLPLAIGAMFVYHIDLISTLVNLLPEQTWSVTPLGTIATGIMVGRGAVYLHQILNTYFPKKETS